MLNNLKTTFYSNIQHCQFQSSEVPNSGWCEFEGIQRSTRFLREDWNMDIGVLVTDRHRQIRAWIRDNLPETKHYFDVWHVSSGMYNIL